MRAIGPFAVLLMCFAALVAAGTVLLSLPGVLDAGRLSAADAALLSTSAATLTGLTPVPISELTLRGQVLLLVLLQVAGILVITASSLYLAVPGASLSRKTRQIVRQRWAEIEQIRPARLLLGVTLMTLAVQAAGALVLYPSLQASGTANPAFTAVFHAVSAFCNAGFTTAENGISALSPEVPVLVPLMILVVLGGLGYVVLSEVAHRILGFTRSLALHARVVLAATFALIVAGTLAFLLFDPPAGRGGGPGPAPLLESLFQAVSARTAGFSLAERSHTPPAGVLTVLLMLVGGAPGSTAGGLKVTTVVLLVVVASRGMRPGDARVPLTRRRAAPEAQGFAVVFTLRALLLLAGASLVLSATETLANPQAGLPFGQLVFEAVSAFTTTGLSSGVTPLLSTPGKVVVVLTMLTGRLGLLALAVRMTDCMSGTGEGPRLGNAARARRRRQEREVLPQGEVLLGG